MTTPSKGIAGALLEFQKNAPHIALDATNPHFRNKYASLAGIVAAIRGPLNEAGLVLTQMPTVATDIDDAAREVLRTRLTHAASGEFIEFDTPIYMAKKDAQAYGSSLTYGRRYAILSTLGLVGDEDDDGEAATRPAPSAPKVAAKPTPIKPAAEPVASRKAPEDDVPFAPDMPDAEQGAIFAPPGDGLTEKQSKMIGTLATKGNKEGWVTVEALREFTDGRFGKTSRKALTKSEASEVIEWLQKLERGDS